MRTTLELDDRVLAAARSMARTRRITLGQAVSELALVGVDADVNEGPLASGHFPMLPPVPGHLITDAMVEQALADD
ncbi:MAG: hypothetical protein ACRCYU_15055 [Nocardioides sp.]